MTPHARRSPSVLSVLRNYKRLARRSWHEMAGRRPKFRPDAGAHNLVELGQGYGGWVVADVPDLRGSVIISAGAGEDISFDLDCVRHLGAQVVIIDPTPRAIDHVKTTLSLMDGKARSGQSSPYDLSGIDPSHISLIEAALWNEVGSIKLFTPVDPKHVSHSAVNFQRGYSTSGSFIEVESVSYESLLASRNIESVSLLKLDIEGAEVEVILSLSVDMPLPTQIAVEYDELFDAGPKATERVMRAHRHLNRLGYKMAYQDRIGLNYLYVRM